MEKPKISTQHSINWRVYGVAALGLLVMSLAAFAVFSPFNGATNDEWSYLVMGQQGQWHGVRVNRDFAAGGAVIANILLPNRAQSIFITHLLFSSQ